MSNWCVLLAAGRGTRSGLSENKVFYKMQGRSILARCIDAFYESGLYDGLVLVLAENEIDRYKQIAEEESIPPIVKHIVTGGSERRISALNGLRSVPADADIVSIHDAARPFVNHSIMKQTIDDAILYGSGVISTPVTDTIKIIDSQTGVVSTPDRSTLRSVQTPQTFRYDEIIKAHEWAEMNHVSVTDDAMLYEKMYGNVHLSSVTGAEINRKFTNPGDFHSEATMSGFRIGHGYDAHRLKEGRRLILCGVDIPYERGLDGHSDADVAVHALMDALLGAAGETDIGHLFPDNDAKYKGISSMLLLKEVMSLLNRKGFSVINADVTIIAQKPKLASFIPQMRENIACAMNVETSCASVKATTTEHMGFEGEEIGISSHAVVLLNKAN